MDSDGKGTTIGKETGHGRIDHISTGTIGKEGRIDRSHEQWGDRIDEAIARSGDDGGERRIDIGGDEAIIPARIRRIGEGIQAERRPIHDRPEII